MRGGQVSKSKAVIAVTLAVVAICTGCGMTSTTVAGTVRAAPAGSASVSQPSVRDGGFEFTVLEVSRAHQVGELEDPGLFVTARGVFVVITLSIRNVGDSPLTFVDSDQTLIDGAGTEFQTSMAANIYGNLAIPSTRINPGDGLVVRISFDVPTHTVPRNLILRESGSSDGVAIVIS
jgi:hypothetical protein